MAQLINTAIATGLYNSISTGLTDTLTTQIVDGLTLTKIADKLSWADGVLTYTITIDNTGLLPYTGVEISDKLDAGLIQLIDGTLEINGVAAEANDYTYDPLTGDLAINPETPLDIAGGAQAVITFQVEKAAP